MDVGYAQASRHILDAYLWAISSQAGANALVAGVGAPVSNKKCWDCGAPGKVCGDGHNCLSPGSGKHANCGRCGDHCGKGNDGKSGGKAQWWQVQFKVCPGCPLCGGLLPDTAKV